MFKSAFNAVAALGILFGLYQGYTRGFAYLADRLRPDFTEFQTRDPEGIPQSQSKRNAIESAERWFGPDHWAAARDLNLHYYSQERGYFLYAQSFRYANNDHAIVLSPFAMIWRSRDGQSVKTAVADEAIVEWDKPISPRSMSQAGKIVRARLNGSHGRPVILRDHKSSVERTDDMAAEMPWVEFSDEKLLIRCDDAVRLWDPNMEVTGTGFQMHLVRDQVPASLSNPAVTGKDAAKTKLRAKAPGSPDVFSKFGYSGVRSIVLSKDVRVFFNNAGSAAFPGSPSRPLKAGETPTPLEVTCAGEMTVDMNSAPLPGVSPPKPQTPIANPTSIAPVEPVLAVFRKNVKVLRGLDKTADSLYSDQLSLELLPIEKKALSLPERIMMIRARGLIPAMPNAPHLPMILAALFNKPEIAGESDGDGLGSFELRQAVATGHNVWLESPTEGLTAKNGSSLIFKRSGPNAPETTVFRGDRFSKLEIVKKDWETEKDGSRTLRGIQVIRSSEVEINSDPKTRQIASLRSVGEGRMESRESENAVPRQTASWKKNLTMETLGEGDALRRRVVLDGQPRVFDAESGTMKAEDRLMLWLKPKAPRPMAKADPNPNPNPNAKLAARAAEPEKTAKPETSAAPQPKKTGPASALTAQSAFQIERVLALMDVEVNTNGDVLKARERLDMEFLLPRSAAPKPDAKEKGKEDSPNEANAAAKPRPVAKTDDEPDAKKAEANESATAAKEKAQTKAEPPKKTEPNWLISAGTIWAEIQPRQPNEPNAKPWSIREVRLRDEVEVHQDPRAGRPRGTDAQGAAIDLTDQGESLFLMRLAGRSRNSRDWAKVDAEDFSVSGPLLEIDQTAGVAKVGGPGKFLSYNQSALTGSDGKPAGPGAGAGAGDPNRNANARDGQVKPSGMMIEFVGDQDRDAPKAAGASNSAATPAPATTPPQEPSVIVWQDRMIFRGRSFSPEGEPYGASAEFFGKVHGIFPDKGNRSDIYCEQLTAIFDQPISFAKTAVALLPGGAGAPESGRTGNDPTGPKAQIVWARGQKRVVLLHQAYKPETKALSEKVRVDGEDMEFERIVNEFKVLGQGVVWHYKHSPPDPRRAPTRPNAPRLPEWELTRISFLKGVSGKINSGDFKMGGMRSSAVPWSAYFAGETNLTKARVANENLGIDPNAPPSGFEQVTAEEMTVENDPPPVGSSSGSKQWLHALAKGMANARTETESIQGDVIKYDSDKSTVQVYGNGVRDVTIVRQNSMAQAPSYGYSGALLYNLRTKQTDLIDPRGGTILNGGMNRAAPAPIPGLAPPRAPAASPRFTPPNRRSDRERSNFGETGTRNVPGNRGGLQQYQPSGS